jgi:hypothetical protein
LDDKPRSIQTASRKRVMSGSTESLLALGAVTVAWLVNAISCASLRVSKRQYAELKRCFDVMTLTGAPDR